MTIEDLLILATNKGASDIFIIAGLPISYKIANQIHAIDENKLTADKANTYISTLYTMANRSIDSLETSGDDDFSFAIAKLSRFRVSAYKQRGTFAAVIRIITFTLPDPKQLHIPDTVIQLANIKKGMVLVTGPAGCGKTTTLACIIDYINQTQNKHIITLSDPIEYLHPHKKSIVSQREIYMDSNSYVTALRAALRQSPDIILLEEMRDYETIDVALTAGETGHLVISTLHTIGAANTIDRIIDVFPSSQQRQVAIQLSMTLQAVISQQLLPTVSGELIPAFEIMVITPAIRNMIRENKIHQLEGIIATSSDTTMISMDQSILGLYKQGIITKEIALSFAKNEELLTKKINNIEK